MIKEEEVKNEVLSASEYDIINEGEYLPYATMYNTYDSKYEFKNDFFLHNKGKTALRAVFELVWGSDFIHFNKDVTGDFIYIKEPIH